MILERESSVTVASRRPRWAVAIYYAFFAASFSLLLPGDDILMLGFSVIAGGIYGVFLFLRPVRPVQQQVVRPSTPYLFHIAGHFVAVPLQSASNLYKPCVFVSWAPSSRENQEFLNHLSVRLPRPLPALFLNACSSDAPDREWRYMEYLTKSHTELWIVSASSLRDERMKDRLLLKGQQSDREKCVTLLLDEDAVGQWQRFAREFPALGSLKAIDFSHWKVKQDFDQAIAGLLHALKANR